jgi:hypothetical protein
MNTSTALDTIAGAKLLQVRFGRLGVFQPNQAVMHEDRRARFIRISDGFAIIRYWDDSDPVAVPPEALSLPPAGPDELAPRAPAGARRAGVTRRRVRLVLRADMALVPRHHPWPRPPLRP